MNIEDELTILTVTHYAPRETYGDLTPPTAGIVEKTVESLRENCIGAESCTHYLFYNYPSNSNADEPGIYEKNLRKLAERKGLVFQKTPNNGLRDTLLKAVKYIDTPYLFFVEHDWVFLEEFQLSMIIKTFNESDDINDIRFNKYKNIEKGWNTIVEEDESKQIPLCKVSSFSNNPHIVRKNVFEDWLRQATPDLTYWLQLYRSEDRPSNARDVVKLALISYLGKFIEREHVRYIDDAEVIIDKKYKSDIEKHGFPKAHEKMGTFLYGSKNGGPYIKHLGYQEKIY